MNINSNKSQIKTDQFWQERGKELTGRITATTGTDPYKNRVQVAAILRHLSRTRSLLDIGCGVGDNTFEFAKYSERTVGIDYSEPLIAVAEKRRLEKGIHNIHFQVGDARKFSLKGRVDTAISIQCLINIMDIEGQKQAIVQVAEALQSGGLYLMLEPSKQGLQSINRYRHEFGLYPIKESSHNNNIDESVILPFLSRYFELEKKDHSLATYHFISRVVHPLVVAPKEPKINSRFNEVAAQIACHFPHISEIEASPLYVLRRR